VEPSFWLHKWSTNDIGFHQKTANALLVEHLPALGLVEGNRIFVPLCGKTLDIRWMLSQRFRVAGAELSRIAVDQLFAELDVVPTLTDLGPLVRYSAPDLDIFVGDIFQLTREWLGAVDAIYDRAAMVALPASMRDLYTAHLTRITVDAPLLLITFEYDQTLAEGPPFSIGSEEVRRHYLGTYDVQRLARADLPGGLRGQCPATENVWHAKHRVPVG